jgi:hypothetical protein
MISVSGLQVFLIRRKRNENIREHICKYANKKYASNRSWCCYGWFGYTEVTSRLTSLETSRELFQADLLKKSEQLPTDQEQYMWIEDLYKATEKLEKTQEQNMTKKLT